MKHFTFKAASRSIQLEEALRRTSLIYIRQCNKYNRLLILTRLLYKKLKKSNKTINNLKQSNTALIINLNKKYYT